MIFTSVEKYVHSKKCLKQRRQLNPTPPPQTPPPPPPPPPPPLTPTPSSSKVESIFAPKRSSGYGCYRGPTCTYSRQGLLLAGKTIEVVT